MSAREFLRCSECRALNEPRALFCSRCGASLYGPLHGVMRRRPRRVTAAGMAMGFAMLLILAACIFLLAVVFARTLAAREDMNVSTGQSGIAATITTVPTGTVSTGFTNITATTGGADPPDRRRRVVDVAGESNKQLRRDEPPRW
jgi:hypothetical protein